MKKYLITSLASVMASIVLIVYLYRTKDIEWVDAIVERSTALVGIEPEIVTYKKEAREKRRHDPEPAMQLLIPYDTSAVSDPVAVVDSGVAALPVTRKTKRLFNLTADSPRMTPLAVDTVTRVDTPKKRKLFNLAVEAAEVSRKPGEGSNDGQPLKLVYFKAEVNERQQFSNDEEIVFRTVEAFPIGSKQVPARYVFRAKANVFGGRIVFVLKNLNDLAVDGQNYADQQQGIPVAAVSKLGARYLLSDGFPVVFGVHL